MKENPQKPSKNFFKLKSRKFYSQAPLTRLWGESGCSALAATGYKVFKWNFTFLLDICSFSAVGFISHFPIRRYDEFHEIS